MTDMRTPLRFHETDGGRGEAGVKIRGRRDCVARAVSIATWDKRGRDRPIGKSYAGWYYTLSYWARHRDGQQNASSGINTSASWFCRLMQEAGWRWVALLDKPVHFCAEELGKSLPNDRTIICRVKKLGRWGGHFATVINGVAHDTWNASDPYAWTRSGRGKIVVMGYWEHESNEPWDDVLDKDTKDEGYD